MKRFTQYFTEEHGKNDACFKLFQDTLFGDILGKKEKDTKTEKEISDDLEDFVIGNLDGRSKDKLVSAFKKLKKCTKHFPKELIPEKNVLYRGVHMGAKRFRDNVIKVVVDKKGGITGTMKWKAKGAIQSWTTKKDVTETFATSYDDDDILGIIMKAKFSPKDLLFSSKFLEKFKAKLGQGIENEHEIIRISNKEIKVEFELLDTIPNLREEIGFRFSLQGYIKLMEAMGISPWLYVIQTDDGEILDFLETARTESYRNEIKKISKGVYGILDFSVFRVVENLGGDFKIIEKGFGAK